MLIHIEVQVSRDPEFPLRMYVYNYRVFDRYNTRVVSLAVLADDDPNWRPSSYRWSLWGCSGGLEFTTVKLWDYLGQESVLENSDNPFAKVVLAHLKTLQTRGNLADRQAWKVRLVRNLYEVGFNAENVRQLFRLIDWMMDLPRTLASIFWQEVMQIQQEKHMPFMTTPERIGMEKGLKKGIELALDVKFGTAGLALMPQIEQLEDLDKLEAAMKAVQHATTVEDVRNAISS